MNRLNGKIPRKHEEILSSDEEEEDSRNNVSLQRKRAHLDNQPTQNVTTPTPDDTEYEGFVKGSIVRVKLNNFVTYSDVEFKPGPRLNVVIGPNGSGKSSIVCAIALGLGGNPNLLGRQKQLSDFVKRGSTSGFVEIELYNPDGQNFIIKREIKKENQSTDFKLNGKNITKTDLLARIKELNIQVENLCQFLPQDKVVSFANLSPTDLLLETEKAIGVDNMYENHQELIKLRADSSKDVENLEAQKDQLENLKNLNQQLEKDVETFREKEKIEEILGRYKQKRAWAIFETLRQQFQNLKTNKEQCDLEIKNANSELLPLKTSILAQENSLKKSKEECEKFDKRIHQLNREVGVLGDNAERMTVQIESFSKELESLVGRERERKRKIESVQNEINSMKNEIEQIPPEDKDKSRIEEILALNRENNLKAGEYQVEVGQLQQQYQRYNTECAKNEREIQSLNNISQQKLEMLRRENPDIYQAYQWINSNRDKFQKPVLGPILMEINVINPENAAYLESAMSWNTLQSFVFQSKSDRELFHRTLTDAAQGGRKLRVNSVLINNIPETSRPVDIEKFRHLGAIDYLDNIYEAEPIIKAAINDAVPIFKSIIFDKRAIGKEEEISTKILSFYTPKASYLTSFSKYGEDKSITRVVNIKPARWLSGVNKTRKSELEQMLQENSIKREEIKQKGIELKQKEKDIQALVKGLLSERNALQANIEKRKKLLARINFKIRELQDLQEEEDIETEGKKIKNKMLKAYEKRIDLQVQASGVLVELMKSSGSKDHATVSTSRFYAKLSSEKYKLDCELEKIKDLTNKAKQLEADYERVSKESRAKRAEAQKIAPYSPDLMEQFKQLKGSNLEEIEDEIKVLETKASFMVSSNPRVIQEYESRKKDIQDLEERLLNFERTAAENSSRLVTLKKKWLEPVQEYINQINQRFSLFFQEIKCEGKVTLGHDPKDENDFSKYCINLQVRFREESKLNNLNPHLQSGGERSVSTMLFLISLQNLTKCPFRVVDEINQGMDPKNERMVFEQIVKTVSKPDLPQYFLITPKLLHNLPYSRETTVLCVFTGPWFLNQNEWEQFLKFYLNKQMQSRKSINNSTTSTTTTTTTTATKSTSRVSEESEDEDEE